MIRLTKEDIINEVQVLGLTHCTNTLVNPLINGFANSSTNRFIIFLINYKKITGRLGFKPRGRYSRPAVFKTAALNHSATFPIC